jgi:hypothetical protein
LLKQVSENSEGMMTRQEIRSAWPEGAVPPAPQTLWRWLERLVKTRQLNRDGEGMPREPFRYWLPGMEERWPQNFMRRIMKESRPARLRRRSDHPPPKFPDRCGR